MNITFTFATGTAPTTAQEFLAAAVAGRVKVYRERGNGTLRHIPFLAEGTADREIAEWVREQRDERTMKDIAAEMHESVPSVRRRLNALEITEEVEAYEDEDLAEIFAAASALAASADSQVSAEGAPEAPQALSAEQAEPQATLHPIVAALVREASEAAGN